MILCVNFPDIFFGKFVGKWNVIKSVCILLIVLLKVSANTSKIRILALWSKSLSFIYSIPNFKGIHSISINIKCINPTCIFTMLKQAGFYYFTCSSSCGILPFPNHRSGWYPPPLNPISKSFWYRTIYNMSSLWLYSHF